MTEPNLSSALYVLRGQIKTTNVIDIADIEEHGEDFNNIANPVVCATPNIAQKIRDTFRLTKIDQPKKS